MIYSEMYREISFQLQQLPCNDNTVLTPSYIKSFNYYYYYFFFSDDNRSLIQKSEMFLKAGDGMHSLLMM